MFSVVVFYSLAASKHMKRSNVCTKQRVGHPELPGAKLQSMADDSDPKAYQRPKGGPWSVAKIHWF